MEGKLVFVLFVLFTLAENGLTGKSKINIRLIYVLRDVGQDYAQ